MADDQQLSAAAAELARRQSAAQIRGLVKLGELIDHLNDVAALAAQGHPQAKELARQYLAAIDALRSAAAGIALVKGN